MSTRTPLPPEFAGAFSRYRKSAALGLVVALVVGASVAHAGDRKSEDRNAAALYHNYCSVCHGDRGDGQSRARGSLNPPPRDFTTPQAVTELSKPRMLLAVREGRPGTAMVGFKSQLSAAQMETVVDYVRETFMRATSNADASRGRQIYAKTCSVCHGDRGAGSMWASANLNPAPRDFSAAAARTELSRERMIVSVTHGRPGTAMAGFATQLSKADIDEVVDYVRGAFMMVGATAGISGTRANGVAPAVPTGAAPTPAARPAAGATAGAAVAASPAAIVVDLKTPLPNGLVGHADAGRRLYQQTCATCHGAAGDGQGPRAYFINPKPRNFVAAESRGRLNRPALFLAITEGRQGTEMPAWKHVLERQQIADVAEYTFQAFIRGDGAGPPAPRGTPPQVRGDTAGPAVRTAATPR